jgi:hypothetical protein
VIRADYDAEIVGHAIVGLLRGAASFGVRRGALRAEVVDTVVAFLLRALVPEGASEAARRHKLLGSAQR